MNIYIKNLIGQADIKTEKDYNQVTNALLQAVNNASTAFDTNISKLHEMLANNLSVHENDVLYHLQDEAKIKWLQHKIDTAYAIATGDSSDSYKIQLVKAALKPYKTTAHAE